MRHASDSSSDTSSELPGSRASVRAPRRHVSSSTTSPAVIELGVIESFSRGVFEVPAASNRTHPTATLLSIRHALGSERASAAPPEVGLVSLLELHDGSLGGLIVTASTMAAPTLAMAELWLRFLAVFLCPACLAWMIHGELGSWNAAGRKREEASYGEGIGGLGMAVHTVGLASSAVLLTDSLYVYQYGRGLGLSLFALSSLLTVRRCTTSSKTVGSHAKTNKSGARKLFRLSTFALLVVTAVVYMRSDGGVAMDGYINRFVPSLAAATGADRAEDGPFDPLRHLPHPGIDTPTIDAGTYHSRSNEFISDVISGWPEEARAYGAESGATPYLVSGDHRTGIPFLVNSVPDQEYVRVWCPNEFDGEQVALDVAFPYSTDGEFEHDATRPVLLVLHGLNGGSFEEYVKDLVMRERAKGSTVVVLIARGMMDTAVRGWNIFHGARTGDVDAAARAVRGGLARLAGARGPGARQTLVGVGFSMGAIVVSNYVARSGEHCALDAAVAISGGLDMRQMLNFRRSMRLWQPMLTFGLREDILLGKFARHIKRRLSDTQFLALLRTTHISALDDQAIVTYNGFEDLVHYYTEMSAMGDREPEFNLFGDGGGAAPTGVEGRGWGRIANVSVPFAAVHALDDPLTAWRTIGTADPQSLADSGSGNVIVVLTESGGHVGWPLGNNPAENKWLWMSSVAGSFANAVDTARRKRVE